MLLLVWVLLQPRRLACFSSASVTAAAPPRLKVCLRDETGPRQTSTDLEATMLPRDNGLYPGITWISPGNAERL